MGRNYFSKQGGPYFINDGFSKHEDHEYIPNTNLDLNLLYGLTTMIVSIILVIGITLRFLN
jgi:hypothetical protein